VYGIAIADLMSLIQRGNNLTEIVNGLTALYAVWWNNAVKN
jgi:hypothetical protein